MKAITLKTLPHATAQEVFDYVVSNLLRQGEKSIFPGTISCRRGPNRYRGPNGLKCAAGWLIADDEYREEFEGKGWTNLYRVGSVPATHGFLISSLQDCHDYENNEIQDWPREFANVARTHNLDTTVIDEFLATKE